MQTHFKYDIVQPSLNLTLLLFNVEPSTINHVLSSPSWSQDIQAKYDDKTSHLFFHLAKLQLDENGCFELRKCECYY